MTTTADRVTQCGAAAQMITDEICNAVTHRITTRLATPGPSNAGHSVMTILQALWDTAYEAGRVDARTD